MNRRSVGQIFSTKGATWLLLVLVLVLNFTIRWRLREMPIERDEGEYAYAGQLILQGVPPYEVAWNMKFPGVYYAYAGLMAIFGETPEGIHVGLIAVTSLSIILVFLIGRELMDRLGGLMAAAIFTLLSAMPYTLGLAAHATHFVVLFVCLGTFALLAAEKKRPWFWTSIAGMSFGMAILMKQHAFVFVPAAGGWLLWRACQRKEKVIVRVGVFMVAVAVPLLVTAGAMAAAGVWDRFNFWTIQYAREYVSLSPLSAIPSEFENGFGPVLFGGAWVWVAGLVGLGVMFFRRELRDVILPGAGLFIAALVAVIPGFYFRSHYFIMVLPGLALLNAMLIFAVTGWSRSHPQIRFLKLLPACIFIGVAGNLLARNAEIWFRLPPVEVSQKLYGFNPFSEAPVIARYIAAHSEPGDTIAVLGSEPEMFFLAGRISASGYIYLYPLTEPQRWAPGMRREFFHEIETARPKYVVNVNILLSWVSVVTPGETDQVLGSFKEWWTGYSTNYQTVGKVDLKAGAPANFYWDQELSSRTNATPPDIFIYRRN